jgi:hypothetical protein
VSALAEDLYPSERGLYVDDEAIDEDTPTKSGLFPIGPTVGQYGGPCPCCGGRVKKATCEECGWDEYGGNVFLRELREENDG